MTGGGGGPKSWRWGLVAAIKTASDAPISACAARDAVTGIRRGKTSRSLIASIRTPTLTVRRLSVSMTRQ
jgi:hypothetical protein